MRMPDVCVYLMRMLRDKYAYKSRRLRLTSAYASMLLRMRGDARAETVEASVRMRGDE